MPLGQINRMCIARARDSSHPFIFCLEDKVVPKMF